jgi:hypothetical protein
MSDDARARALVEELGTQLARMKGAGPKLREFLSMIQLDREPPSVGRTVPFSRVKRVIESDLGARMRDLFDDFDEEPFAVASLGQVHRARTAEGADVAVKVQHAGAAEAVEADLRGLGLIGPIVKRLAPELDAGAVLAELRERVSDELDYEVEAQHQRRLERRFRGHPHVRVPRVYTALCTRRVLVSEHVEGLEADAIAGLSDAERDRLGEVAFRFFFGLVWRDGIVAGDPHPDNCIVSPDGRLCVLDFGLQRDLDAAYREGERDIMRALSAGDAERVRDGLSGLGYLPDPGAFDPGALLEHLRTAGAWLIAPGFRRIDAEYVGRIVELGYPPRSPHFAAMRRMRMPPPTLLLRRMELQVLSLLGEFRAGADWAAISAEQHSSAPPSTALGRADRAFFG